MKNGPRLTRRGRKNVQYQPGPGHRRPAGKGCVMINRRARSAAAAAVLAMGTWGAAQPVHAADETPDALIKRVSTDVLETIKKDPSLREGDVSKVNALVNDKVMPYVNFRRMTSA